MRPDQGAPGHLHAAPCGDYQGLLTKAEGEAWFAVVPECAANVIPPPAVSRKDVQ